VFNSLLRVSGGGRQLLVDLLDQLALGLDADEVIDHSGQREPSAEIARRAQSCRSCREGYAPPSGPAKNLHRVRLPVEMQRCIADVLSAAAMMSEDHSPPQLRWGGVASYATEGSRDHDHESHDS
jgi:hypothetical protein